MNKILLTLATAFLAAGTAFAQFTPKLANVNKMEAKPKAKFFRTAPTTQSIAPATNILGKRHTLADTELATVRNPKELSYQVLGNEHEYSQIIPSGITATTINSAGFTGWGAAIAIPVLELRRFGGNTISKIHVHSYLGTYADSKVFIAELNDSTGAFEPVWEKDVTIKSNRELSFDCDYVIPKNATKTLYIGWSSGTVTVSNQDEYSNNSNYGVPMYGFYDNTQTANGDIFVVTRNGASYYGANLSFYDSNNEYNPVSNDIWAETTGEGGLLKEDACIYEVDDVRDYVGYDKNVNVVVANMGVDSIRNFEYTVTTPSETRTYIKQINGGVLHFMNNATFSLPIGAIPGTPGRTTDYKLEITKVNGVADNYTADEENVADITTIALDKCYKRTPVFEEFTSTSCGWCPRGIVGLEKVADSLGEDKVVTVSVHGDYSAEDALTAESYSTYFSQFGSSLPMGYLNRQYQTDPYYDIVSSAKYVAAQPCEASASISSKANRLSKKVTIDSEFKFAIDIPANTYAVEYIITEDNVTGVGQLNYYTYFYVNQPETFEKAFGSNSDFVTIAQWPYTTSDGMPYSNITMNHVARYVQMAGTVASAILPAVKAGESFTDKATISLPTDSKVSINIENLKVAAVLVDGYTGKIVTGVQAKAGVDNTRADETDKASGIDEASANASAVAEISAANGAFLVKADGATAQVFDANGRLVSSATVQGEASLPVFGNGVYVIRVLKGTQSMTQKAIF